MEARTQESLDFSDLIDGYRQYAGPANLAERRIVSSECGAVKGEGFVQTLPELLWKVKRSYAGGLNQYVFHGYPYSGQYGNTTWPVFTTFNYQYSDMHGPHAPAWAYYKDQMDFVARNNWVMQAGVPKIDVALWQKVTVYPGHVQLRTYEPSDLEETGYTYEYLSPDNFDLPSATVVDGILAPDAQAFKVMVVRANDSLTIDGVSKLVEFAQAGLPIVLAGGIPKMYVGTYKPLTLRQSKRSLRDAVALPNVHVTNAYAVASTLEALGIRPRTRITAIAPANATWFTNWRSDENNSVDYVFIYNDVMHLPQGQGSSTGSIEFQSVGVPFAYDAWTGEQKPVLAYNTTSNSTLIPFTLAGNQSVVIAFHSAGTAKNLSHLSHIEDGVVGYSSTEHGLLLKVAFDPSGPPDYNASTSSATGLTLTDWTLIVEHWDPPANLYNITGGAYKHNTTHNLPSLVSWQAIPGLQNVSGRGYYSTTFSWPGLHDRPDGAILDFGWVYDTLQVFLNGHQLPPLDVTSPKLDVKQWLVVGENKVEAIVATPLGNVLIPIWYQLQTSGEGPGSPDASTVPPPIGQYGLQADVTLTPYKEVKVK
ncbi:hypothetical protein LTR36_005205 [Oleoguttula mirabilis]|uniref:Beta-galactosidase n=1 Tax=Oleoguttula mirabilis TaxID=1507867 RepID=A0AAV9JWI8_9PEZI|nr:hypothetical protein LTR36_005205 [Oleoguttula mirabilis]